MKNAIAAIAVLALSGVAFAQTPPAPTPPASPAPATDALKAAAGPDLGEAAAGEVVYLRYCAACHGKSLKGDGPVASGLTKKPVDLTQLAKNNKGTFPFDKVAATIDGRQTTRMHGNPDMPVWGEIFSMTKSSDAPTADTAVKRIVSYIWTLQERSASADAKK